MSHVAIMESSWCKNKMIDLLTTTLYFVSNYKLLELKIDIWKCNQTTSHTYE